MRNSTFTYYLPTKIVFGRGVINSLPELISKNFPGKQRILLVTGKTFLKKHGFTDKILYVLDSYTVVVFDKVEPNPSSSVVDEGIAIYKKNNCDLIIGFGGGSVLDAAKAMALLTNNTDSLEEYQSGKILPKNPAEDYMAIPTTSGTSSEMTMWSVITNLEGAYKNLKKSIGHPFLYPKLAVIDPELTITLPPFQTVSTGLDALCHAIEGYWSKKRNILSDVYLLEAIRLIIQYLPIVYKDGNNGEAREKMSFAVLLAGLGFSNSRTTSSHKISYPLTTHYNLPHGAACALTLPYFLEYMGEREPELITGILNVLECKTVAEAADFLRSFIKKLGMPVRLSEIGVTKEGLMFISKESYVSVDKQEDPVPIEYDEYVGILEKAF